MDSQLSKLDKVLEYIIQHPNTSIPYNNILKEFNQYPRKELTEMILKLEKDEYILKTEEILFNSSAEYIYSTFEGRLFYENGGYEKKKEIDDIIYATNVLNENQIKSDQRKLLWGTWFAGIAALLVLLWYILVWFCPHPYDCFCKI